MQRTVAYLLLTTLLFASTARSARADEAAWRDKIARAERLLGTAARHQAGGERTLVFSLGRQAAHLLAQAERDRPGQAHTALLTVHARVYEGDRDAAYRALDLYRSRSSRGDGDPELLYARALVAYHLDRRPDRAREALEQLLEDPESKPTAAARELYYLSLLGEAAYWWRQAECERALPLLHRAAEVARESKDGPRARRALSRAAVVLDYSQRHREAEVLYRRLAEEEPDNPLWHFNLALVLANQARFEQAIPSYRRTLELLADHPVSDAMRARFRQAWLRLGNCHRILAGGAADPAVRAAQLKSAREGLERYIELVPEDARGHFWYGRLLYDELDLPHEALDRFQRAHALDPVCDAALGQMIQIAHRHRPRPTGDVARDATARDAWGEQLRIWEREYAEKAAERAQIRRERRARSTDGGDGCT